MSHQVPDDGNAIFLRWEAEFVTTVDSKTVTPVKGVKANTEGIAFDKYDAAAKQWKAVTAFTDLFEGSKTGNLFVRRLVLKQVTHPRQSQSFHLG